MTQSYMAMLQRDFGLDDWNIRVADEPPEDDELGHVYTRMEERVAVIRVRRGLGERQQQRVIAHELIHVLLKNLEYLACNDKPIQVMDIIHDEIELICNKLATAFTGVEWEPTTEGEKRWYAPFVPEPDVFASDAA